LEPKWIPEGPMGPKKLAKMTPKGPQRPKNTQKKLQTTMKKDPTNTSKSYLYNNVKNITSKPKNGTTETFQTIKTNKTLRKPIKII